MALDTGAPGGPVVTVSSSEELARAYRALSANPEGGTIEVAADARRIEIDLEGGGKGPVRITSEDPSDPADLSLIRLRDVDNVTVEGFRVDSTGVSRADWIRDLMIHDSSDIEIRDVAFEGGATGFYDPKDPDAVLGGRFGRIDDSTRITFEDNTVEGYSQGLTVLESTHVTVAGNEMSGMQGDGIRMGGVQEVLIADNHLHDFYGSPNSFNHNDMIQMWSTNTTLLNRDVAVVGNILDSGEGAATQGIFMGNERYRNGETDHLYRNITIMDNVIYNGAPNGIAVGAANGVSIENNTLLWNSEAVKVKDGDSTATTAPRISVHSKARDVTVADNITSGFSMGRDVDKRGNKIVTYDSPSDPGYADRHFLNVIEGGQVGPDGWRLRPDSPWNGEAGAEASAAILRTDGGVHAAMVVDEVAGKSYAYRFDAGVSADADGLVTAGDYVYHWRFSDGTVKRGLSVTHDFGEPGTFGVTLTIKKNGRPLDTSSRELTVEPQDFLALDFEDGFADASPYAVDIDGAAARIVSSSDGDGYRIGGDVNLSVDRSNAQIHDLDAFGISLDLRMTDTGAAGRFLHFREVLEAKVRKDGKVAFTLETDAGSFTLVTPDAPFRDGKTHSFAVGYDSGAGRLALAIDGEVVAATRADGVTAGKTYFGLTIGDTWGNSLPAVVDNVYFGADPASVGIVLEAGSAPRASEAGVKGVQGDADGAIVEETAAFREDALTDGWSLSDKDALVRIDFDDGLVDVSGYGSKLREGRAKNLVETEDGQGYRIGDDAMLTVARSNAQIHELDGFALALDIALLNTTDTGRFLHFHKVFDARIAHDRSVVVTLRTDEGRFRLDSGEVTLDAPGAHRFELVYDGARLEMRIDGAVVDSVAASGTTAKKTYHGLTIGERWTDRTVDAVVDEFVFAPVAEGETVETFIAEEGGSSRSTSAQDDPADDPLQEIAAQIPGDEPLFL